VPGHHGWSLFFEKRGNPFPEVKVFSHGFDQVAQGAILTQPFATLSLDNDHSN
jgi:hypothetical protein